MKTNNQYVILCPVATDPKKVPGNQLFGSNYFEQVAKEDFGKEVKVKYLRFDQKNYGSLHTCFLNVLLAYKIMRTKHDLVYYCTDPVPLFLLAFLHTIGIYRKPIIAWKYIAINHTGNWLKDQIKKFSYKGFYKLFMVTEKHVKDSIKEGLIDGNKLIYKKWGEDLIYVDKLKADKSDKFTFITTGKAYRDFKTLCEAFGKVKNASLKIFTAKEWGPFKYTDYLNTVNNPNIEIAYAEDLIKVNGGGYETVLDYLYSEIHKASCAVSICRPVNFGVGYTQVLDSLACSIPVIATWNKDNPVDLDKYKVGMTVKAEDADDLARVMNYMVTHPDECSKMGINGRHLVEQEYNIRNTAHEVLKCFI